MKDKIYKNIIAIFIFILAAAFAVKFAAPAILRAYVKTGVGTCQTIPVFCLSPEKEIVDPELDKDYISGLLTFNFAPMEIRLPKGITVIKEKIKKVYYKKNKRLDKGVVAYLLYENPEFFTNLFPQFKRQNITNDYEFFKRIMYSRIDEINNLQDTFFIIMKSVFIPDLGRQGNINMVKFTLNGKKGFINYSLGEKENYFDCNIFDSQGNFFKIYIKDRGVTLDLNKVMAVISTVKRVE